METTFYIFISLLLIWLVYRSFKIESENVSLKEKLKFQEREIKQLLKTNVEVKKSEQ